MPRYDVHVRAVAIYEIKNFTGSDEVPVSMGLIDAFIA